MAPSHIQQWSSFLEMKKRKSNLNEELRINKISQYLQELSTRKQCFQFRENSKGKSCHCLKFLDQNDTAKNAIAKSILMFVRTDKKIQQRLVMTDIRSMKDLQQATGSAKSGKFTKFWFRLPFVDSHDEETNETLNSTRICKHAYADVYRYGRTAFDTLEKNANNNTYPDHGNKGRLSAVARRIREEVIPRLETFFKEKILPLAGPRPTRFTACRVLKRKVCVDSKQIMELDPGNTKRRLYGSFAWENGWSLERAKNGTIKRSVRTDDAFDGKTNLICSRWTFDKYWNDNYSNYRVRKASKDICEICFQYEQAERARPEKKRKISTENSEDVLREASRNYREEQGVIDVDGSDDIDDDVGENYEASHHDDDLSEDDDTRDANSTNEGSTAETGDVVSDGNNYQTVNTLLLDEYNSSDDEIYDPNKDECVFDPDDDSVPDMVPKDLDDDDDDDDDWDDHELPESLFDYGDGGAAVLQFTEDEARMVNVSLHVREAASMRNKADAVIDEAKKCTRLQVSPEDTTYTLVVDYMMNMELPFYGSAQPGITYYYTPMNVYTLGIVDCNGKKDDLRDHLYGYIYDEGEGGKGGNAVASLLMKHLNDRNLLDGKKRKKLSIIMDNCAGQNKNNSVLRLASYLVRKGHFSTVEFVFLVAGHTKNAADRFFNALKLYYRDKNVYSMKDLIDLCGKHEQVTSCRITWKDFKNWGAYLEDCYKKIQPMKKYQIFVASEELGDHVIQTYSSNLDDDVTQQTHNLRKRILRKKKEKETKDDYEKRKAKYESLLRFDHQPEPFYTKRPELRDEKKVELYTKYRAVVPDDYKDELCPYPGDQVMERVLKIKDFRKKMKQEMKDQREKHQRERETDPKQKAVENEMKDLEAIDGFIADHIESDDEDEEATKEEARKVLGVDEDISNKVLSIDFGSALGKKRNYAKEK